jgi:hypothetical protein
MAALLRQLVLVLALLGAGCATSFAQDASAEVFEQKLKNYDPAAVEAARGYSQTFNFKTMMEKSLPALSQAVAKQIKAKNPNLTDQEVDAFVQAFLKGALVDSAPILEQATIVMMLDILSKDELIALNNFYSSPTGAGILKKMPILMGRLPELMQVMQTYVVPRALATAREQMKKEGVDIKI